MDTVGSAGDDAPTEEESSITGIIIDSAMDCPNHDLDVTMVWAVFPALLLYEMTTRVNTM